MMQLPKLDSHTMINCNGILIIFGGFQNGYKSSNLYKIDVTDLSKAIKVDYIGVKPCSRSNHSSTIVNGAMYMYGGISEDDTRLCDLWKYDIATCTWSEVKSDNSPIGRCNHCIVALEGNIVMFGGQTSIGKEKNDLYLFDCAAAK